MMSLSAIRELADERARIAAESNLQPYVPFDAAEIDRWPRFPFPNIGSYRPEGWKLIDDWLCDKTGWGALHEPALTVNQLKARLKQHADAEQTYGYAIIEEGQFQIVLGVFQKSKE
jgi:hypothetical protein